MILQLFWMVHAIWYQDACMVLFCSCIHQHKHQGHSRKNRAVAASCLTAAHQCEHEHIIDGMNCCCIAIEEHILNAECHIGCTHDMLHWMQDGATPLNIACSNDHLECAQLLLASGACDVDVAKRVGHHSHNKHTHVPISPSSCFSSCAVLKGRA